jgi:cbb3-type cytochrome oxidase subunit 3
MTDCVQNLIIFLLIIILFYGAHAYIHNKKRKRNHVNYILENEKDKVVVVYPNNNNNLNEMNELNNLNDLNEINHHEYIPDDNIILIEENQVVTGDNFNYDKNIDVLNGFDPDDKYLSVN